MQLLKTIVNFFKSENNKKQYADCIILDAFGNVLLLKRSYQDDFGEGKWSLPGGKIEEKDASPEAAAIRELEEETGIKLSSLYFVDTIENDNAVCHYFIGFLNNLQLIRLDNNEHYGYEFVSPDDFGSYDLLLDLKERLEGFNVEEYQVNNIKNLSPEDKILKDVDNTKLSKAFDKGRISEEDYCTYVNVRNAISDIRKGFDAGMVDEDTYLDYLFKSKRYEFVRVVRGGKQFYQYRLVGTDKQEEPEENMEVGGYFEDDATGLKVSLYSDKSFLITGNTYKNLELLRAIKAEVGIGSWNKTLNGWVFPSNAKSKIMSMLAEKMDVSTYEGQVQHDNIIAIKNAVEPGTNVTVNGEETKVQDVAATGGEAVYTVDTKEGEKQVSETEIGIPAEDNTDKAEEIISETDEATRFQSCKELGGKEEGESPISKTVEEAKGTDIEVKDITTRSGETIKALDYTDINLMDVQLVNQETILDKEKPYWVPDINEGIFEKNKFVFNFVKQDESNVIVALNGYGYYASKSTAKKNEKADYAIMPIEQMLAIQDYYIKKKKADIEKKNDEMFAKELETLKNWDEKKMNYYKPFSYTRLSAKQKKQWTEEQWNELSVDQKIAEVPNMTKPVFAKQSTRLSILPDDKYHVEYFNMYKQLVNHLDTGWTGGRYVDGKQPSVLEWNEVRKIVDYKKADMQMQREENDSTYVKGKETSYGDSNTKDDLLDTLGVKIKRQDGSELKANQTEQIKSNLEKVYESFGNRSEMSKKFGLKISHAGDKKMHASKALGVYIPGMHAIGVSADPMYGKFGFTLAHEFAHFMDNYVGKQSGRWYASDNYNSTAGKIATTFRENMNQKSDSVYINRTCECFARALEQYHAMLHNGDDVIKIAMSGVPYVDSPEHVNKEKFKEKIAPLIEQFLSENDHLLKSTLEIYFDVEDINIIEKAELPTGDPSHGGKLIRVTKTDKNGKKVTKWVSPEDANKEISDAKGSNHHVQITHKKHKESELRNFAKEASEDALQSTIKNSGDEKLRKIAHEELDRRSKEEAVQEDDKGTDKKPKQSEGNKEKVDDKFNKRNDDDKSSFIKDKAVKKGENELLDYLLGGKGEVSQIGDEKQIYNKNGIKVFESPYGSYRYVKYDKENNPVSAIQIMSRDKEKGLVSNAFTKKEERGKGFGNELLSKIKEDFKTLDYSDDLSESGASFIYKHKK